MRLIDADAMREEWIENGQNEYVYDTNAVLDSIDEQHTIEAEPVPHGYWRKCTDWEWDYECSICEEKAAVGWCGNNNLLTPYCPNCGAKMDGKEKANE